MRPRPVLLALLALAGCTARLGAQRVDDAFPQAVLRRAHGLTPLRGADSARLQALLGGLQPPSDASGGGGAFDAEGLIRLDADAEAFLVALSDPARAGPALEGGKLGQEQLLLVAYARNPGVLSARAAWRAAVRMVDQATYLDGILLRYRAFAEAASPTRIDRPMAVPAFPYPGVVALRGQMIGLEVRMAREAARMRLRDAMADVVMAYVETLARADEAPIREEQVALTERLLASARARAAAGTSPNAEVLEAEVEVAMARSQRSQTADELAAAKARLNTLLDREPSSPLHLASAAAAVPPAPVLDELLRLADEFSPEIRMARLQTMRTAAAIRMGEAMLLSPSGPRPMTEAAGQGMESPAQPLEVPNPGGRGDGMASMGAGDRQPATPSGGEAAQPMGGAGMGEAAGEPPRASLAQDLAWLAELRERRSALEHAAEEARATVGRSVIQARLACSSAERMLSLAEATSAPLARQALSERMSAYETGRSEFSELVAALARVLESGRQVVEGRRMLREAEARLWMAVGARPSVVAGSKQVVPR